MEEPQLPQVEENPERARYLAELSSMLEEIKPQALSGVLKVEHKIGGGLKDSQELISGIEPQHTVLDEQKESALLEDELLPPTSEVDMMALEKVRRDIPEYLKPRREVSPHSVRMYSFPVAERPAISKAVEIKKEFIFKDIETAIINFLRGKTLVKDEVINLVSDHKDEISPKENRTRVTISGVIEDLLNRKRLVADREGKLSIVIAGGSTNSPDEENLSNLKWSLPANVIGEFDEILTNEHDPVQRKRLIAFHQMDMDITGSPTDFEKRLFDAKKRGVFNTAQYTKLVSALKMAPSGFVPEPPPVVEQEVVPPPPVIENQDENFEKILILDAGAFTVASDRHSGHNEDKFLEYKDGKTFGVFDGMGGVEGGERASMLAMKNVQEHVSQIPADASVEEVRQTLKAILEDANRIVFNDPFQSGKDTSERMGTTATIVKIVEDVLGEKKIVVASVGDSRVYIYRADGDFEQVTIDANRAHAEMKREGKTEDEIRVFQKKSNNASSLSAFDNTDPAQRMSEIMRYKQRNEIASALGVLEETTVDTYTRDLHNGDITLVTSDGVHDNLTDNEIEFYITACVKKGFTADEISKFLVEKALERSRQVDPGDPTKKHFRAKSDDITALVFNIKPINKVQEPTLPNVAHRELKEDPLDLQKIITPVEDPVARVESLNKGGVAAGSKLKKKTTEEQIAEKAKPSQVTKENIAVPVKEESLVFGPMTKEQAEMDEVLREKVSEARKDFAMYEVAYKKGIRDKRKWYQNLMSELGASEKQLPSIEKEQFHREAEEVYMEAKWNLKNFMVGRDIQKFKGSKMVFGEVGVGTRLVDVGLMDQAENEFRVLQKQILETTPLEEKGRIKQALEVLARRPTYEKVIVGSALTALAIGLVGGGGVTAAFAMFGKRIIKSTAGVSGAIGTGKWIDGVKRKVDKEARADRFADYGEKVGATREDFEKEEKTNEQFFKDQEMYDKRIRLAKAATMAVVGGLSAATAGVVEGAVTDTFTTPGVKINPDSNVRTKGSIPEGTKPRASWFDKLVKKEVVVEQTPAPKVSIPIPEKIIEAPAPEVYPNPVAVPLSSKGFIDTIDQLKQATEGQKLTPALERILNQTPQKIAMDLGLYKPGQVEESAFGYQNEKLSIDINGNLSLEHTGGNEVLMDSKGTLKPFAGKMFDADKTSTSPLPIDAVEVPVAPKVAEVIPQTPKPVAEAVPEVAPVEIKSSVSKFDVAADVITPATALVEVKPGVPLEFDQTVIKSPEYTGPQDMISGKLPLKPEYQFDPQYKPERTTYNIRLEKELMSIPANMFDLRFPIEYNGGRINVFQKGNDLLILLNGQKIGTGLMIDGQPGLQYEKSLGTGVFGVKSDFEKAFETAEKAIMKNKMFFKKP